VTAEHMLVGDSTASDSGAGMPCETACSTCDKNLLASFRGCTCDRCECSKSLRELPRVEKLSFTAAEKAAARQELRAAAQDVNLRQTRKTPALRFSTRLPDALIDLYLSDPEGKLQCMPLEVQEKCRAQIETARNRSRRQRKLTPRAPTCFSCNSRLAAVNSVCKQCWAKGLCDVCRCRADRSAQLEQHLARCGTAQAPPTTQVTASQSSQATTAAQRPRRARQ
jgi:hypothetical protein